MADEKKEETKSALQSFKEKLSDKAKLKETLTEGIKHTDARVRSLAAKVAFKTQEHPFIKQHVLPLLTSEKSKKVLRTIGEKMHRKDLAEKLEKILTKAAPVKKEETPATPEAPKA